MRNLLRSIKNATLNELFASRSVKRFKGALVTFAIDDDKKNADQKVSIFYIKLII